VGKVTEKKKNPLVESLQKVSREQKKVNTAEHRVTLRQQELFQAQEEAWKKIVEHVPALEEIIRRLAVEVVNLRSDAISSSDVKIECYINEKGCVAGSLYFHEEWIGEYKEYERLNREFDSRFSKEASELLGIPAKYCHAGFSCEFLK